MKERWWVAEEHLEALEAHLRVSTWMQPGPERELLSSDRQSAAVRVEGSPALFVKWRRPRHGKARRTFLRASRERLEARAARRLDRLGIPTPQPWAVGELRERGALRGAVLVRAFTEDYVTAREQAAAEPASLERCAAALAGWHESGFRHGDCYPKNMLVLSEEAVQPIGYPKASFASGGPRWDKARRKDLGQFAAGFLELGLDPFAWVAAYVAALEETSDTGTVEARARAAFERVMERKRARLASQAAREPEGPPPPEPLAPEVGADAEVLPLRDLEG
jgi:hypothetical protein